MPYIHPFRPSGDNTCPDAPKAAQRDSTDESQQEAQRPPPPPPRELQRRRGHPYRHPFEIEGKPATAQESPDDHQMGDRRVSRKKSGETTSSVLRPTHPKVIRSLSSSTAKSVRFDSHVDVRSFLYLDRPATISADPVLTVPGETLDFPRQASPSPPLLLDILTPLRPVGCPGESLRLERLRLATDQMSLLGWAAVANLAYEKQVHCRFTFDGWETISEVAAAYAGAVPGTAEEYFDFSITLPDSMVGLEHPALILCLRYRVKGHEFWDNNSGANYRVRFCQPAAADVPSPAPWTVAVEQGRRPTSFNMSSSPLAGPLAWDRPSALARYNLDAQLYASRIVAGMRYSDLVVST